MNMKRVFDLLLTLAMALSLAACGAKKEEAPAEAAEAPAEERYLRGHADIRKVLRLPVQKLGHFLRGGRVRRPGNAFLVAEAAPVRAADMRYEYRNISPFHSP